MSLAEGQFVRNVVVMATGTFGAHGVSIVFAPLITRLYGPDTFGVFGTFNALLAVLVPIAALALPIAIVLPSSDSEAAAIGRLSAMVSLAITMVLVAVLYVIGDQILWQLSMESIGNYVILLPLAMLAAAITQIFRQWMIRRNQFRKLANLGILHALVVNAAIVVSGLLYPFALALIVITVVGQGFYALLLSRTVKWYKQSSSPRNYRELLQRYREFPLYRAPQDFINAISQSMPIVLMASLFGASPAGLYALAKLVMGVPSALLGTAMRDVFYPKVTRMAQSGACIDRLIIRATIGLAVIGILPFALVVVFGPQMFSWMFGDDWDIAGQYARWLALFFFFNFINKPSVAAVPVLGIQRGLLIYEVFSTGGKVLGLIAGYHFFQDDVLAVALFSFIGMVAYVAMIVWIILTAKARGGNEQKAG